MRTVLRFLVCFALASLVVLLALDKSDSPEDAALKLQFGAYYWTGSAWTPMQRFTMPGGAKNIVKLFVPGLTPQFVWTFRDPSALVQIQDVRPLFCVKFYALPPGMPNAPSDHDLLLVRFDQKKDHRELQTANGGDMFTFKAGLSKDRMPDVDITAVDLSTYLVSPRGDLAPGEYLLSASSMGVSGYDFGFHPR